MRACIFLSALAFVAVPCRQNKALDEVNQFVRSVLALADRDALALPPPDRLVTDRTYGPLVDGRLPPELHEYLKKLVDGASTVAELTTTRQNYVALNDTVQYSNYTTVDGTARYWNDTAVSTARYWNDTAVGAVQNSTGTAVKLIFTDGNRGRHSGVGGYKRVIH